MAKLLAFVSFILMACLTVVTAVVAANATSNLHLQAAAHADDMSDHDHAHGFPALSANVSRSHHAIVPIETRMNALRRHGRDVLRRLFGIDDAWSWFSDAKQLQMLRDAKDKLAEMRKTMNEKDLQGIHEMDQQNHRRLKKPDVNLGFGGVELGPMFHTLRFFANRIGEVNDDAFTAQEIEAARLAALGSTSSSSSMDAEAKEAAAVEASRAKAAAAYGLASPEPTTAAPTTAAPVPTPTPTMKSVLASMEW